MATRVQRTKQEAAQREAPAVESASRDTVNGRMVLSVPAQISGLTVSRGKS